MGFSVGTSVGPVRASKRIGGKRRFSGPSPDRQRVMAKRQAKLLAMTDRQFANHLQIQWTLVGLFGVWMLASAWPLVFLTIPLGLLVVHLHRDQLRARQEAARAALPAIDHQEEARKARELGLPDGVWEDATPTVPILLPYRDAA